MRERLRDILVREPVLISLTLRWFGWLVALLIIASEAAPPENLEQAVPVLLITFLQLFLMSIYPSLIRPRFSDSLAHHTRLYWPIIDGLLALWSIHMTGGWDSPFYHYAVTIVLAPSLRYGLGGALVSSSFFSIGFLCVVYNSPAGFSAAFDNGQAAPELVSNPLNPFMIGLYAAFLGEVVKKLQREMERSKRLAAENERARLARDIHDGVSQTLFMVAMSLESGQVLAQREGASKTLAHLETLTPVAQKALLELRNAMHSVEPLSSGDLTLDEAVAALVGDYRSATGITIDYQTIEKVDLPQHLSAALFPMVQEALSNACQHSEADLISVVLDSHTIEIRDNGRGFSPESTKLGRGLKNLKDRASDAGLTYSLQSDESGTNVRLSWKENT